MKKNQWEKNFQKFSNKFNIVKFFGEYNIEKYLNDLNKDTRILDFGCGKGKILEFLKKKKFKNFYGFDITKNLIQKNLQNKLILSKDKSINILKNYKFNYVLFNGTLHHLSDPFLTIKKLLNFHEKNFKSKNFYVIGIEPTNTILRLFGEFIILKTFIGDIFFKDLKNCLIEEWQTYKPWKEYSLKQINNKLIEIGLKKQLIKKTLFNTEFIYFKRDK